MMNQIQKSGGRVKGVLWYQGENDASTAMEGAVYKQAFLEMVDSIRRDTGQPELPFLYVQVGRFYVLGPTYAKTWEDIREAQRHAGLERKNMSMVSALDVPLSDLVHVSADGQVRWARRLAEAALSKVYDQAGHGSPIQVESIKIMDRESGTPSIHLHFSGVTGRLSAEGRLADFEVRTENPTAETPSFFRTDLDPADPAGLILRVLNPLTQPATLIYGVGSHPYCNIVDEKDMPVPAFGPIDLPVE